MGVTERVLIPYPIYDGQPPTPKTAALSAIGKCRIHPASYTTQIHVSAFADIVSKTILQSTATSPDDTTKFQKQSIALASHYLIQLCGLDPSVVAIEVVLPAENVLNSGGCLAACFLDGGCDKIVVDGRAIDAVECMRLPRNKIVAHYVANIPSVGYIKSLAGHRSIDIKSGVNAVQTLPNDVEERGDTGVVTTVMMTPPKIGDGHGGDGDGDEAIAKMLKEIGLFTAMKVNVGLVNPSAKQLGSCFMERARTDRVDGLFTTVVTTRLNEALGLVYSSKESVIAALECNRGVYYSRSRAALWRKGDTSGHYQNLHLIEIDCDADALRFTVTQRGKDCKAFCHLNDLTCWGKPTGFRGLEETLAKRMRDAPVGSYTKRLFNDPVLLRNKLVEEAQELSECVSRQHGAEEMADVLYFAMVKAATLGVTLDDVAVELDKRDRKVTRRKGDSKEDRIKAADAILKK